MLIVSCKFRWLNSGSVEPNELFWQAWTTARPQSWKKKSRFYSCSAGRSVQGLHMVTSVICTGGRELLPSISVQQADGNVRQHSYPPKNQHSSWSLKRLLCPWPQRWWTLPGLSSAKWTIIKVLLVGSSSLLPRRRRTWCRLLCPVRLSTSEGLEEGGFSSIICEWGGGHHTEPCDQGHITGETGSQCERWSGSAAAGLWWWEGGSECLGDDGKMMSCFGIIIDWITVISM